MRIENPSRRTVLAALAQASLLGLSGLTLGGCEHIRRKIAQRRTRRDLATLAANDPIIETYRAAVAAMKALPASDPRSWNRQAQIHFDFCPHSNWFFLPWHRAYLLYFEQICCELTGNQDFALPYWNWTCNRTLPAPFLGDASNALFEPGRSGVPPAALPDPIVGTPVIDSILDETNFLLFGSSPASGQRDFAGSGPLEGTPHNYVHGFVGGIMGSYQSPRDPIFWMHHNMIERIWWEWNIVRGNANTNDSAWVNFPFNGNFVDRNGNSVNTTVGALSLAPLLLYQFDTSPITSCGIGGLTPAQINNVALRRFLEEGGATRIERLRTFQSAGAQQIPVDGAASVLLRARDPALSADATLDADTRVLLRIFDVKQPATGDFFVRVFINLPSANASTAISDPHYAGSFAFFFDPAHATHGAGGAATHGGHGDAAFLVDATPALRRLRQLDMLRAGGEISVQLVAVRGSDQPPKQKMLSIGGLELQLARSIARQPQPFGEAPRKQ
jgi:tyrosinase